MPERLNRTDPASIVKRKIALLGVEAIFGLLVSKVLVEGRENLQKSKELLDAGKPLFIMANHLSNLDGLLVYIRLQKTVESDSTDECKKRIHTFEG